MFDFLKKFVLDIVLGFLIRQWMKFVGSFNWDMFIATAKERLPGIIPFEFADQLGVDFAVRVIEIIRDVASGDLMERVVHLATEGKWQEAFNAVKDAVIGAVQPGALITDENREELFFSSVETKVELA
jgi:hypothetical protein